MKGYKKGFTLIEILAAITILGILSAIAIVSVNKIIQIAKEKHYKTAEKNLILAGQSYVQENRGELPKTIGQKKIIYLKTLQEKNYIKEVLDYNENECDVESSYVQIYKYSPNDYSYLAYLKCPSYKTNIKSKDLKPYVKIEFSGKEEKNAEATITMEDDNKLISYNYIVYRGTKEVKNSGSIAINNYSKKVVKKVDLSSYTPGKLKVVAVATNIYGNTYTAAKEYNFEDKVNPICEYITEEDHPDNPKPWTNSGTRKITVGCQDGEGSGCTRDTFTKTFKETTKIGTIKLSDEAGNTYDCQVSVYIDKTKPTITVNVYKLNKSGNKTDKLIITETVNHSNSTKTLDLSSLSTTRWLNKKDYEYGLYYEVEFSDGQALDTYKVTENSAGLSTSSIEDATTTIINDTSTGKTKSVSFKTTADGYRTYILTASDDAGNTSTLNIITPIDREAPSVPTISMYKWESNNKTPASITNLSAYINNTWSNLNIYTTASNSNDKISGFKEYQYTTSTNYTSSETYSITTEGTTTIKYRACDNAGNCSNATDEKTVKLDKTNPKCNVSGGSNKWTNGSRTIKAECKDNTSGCATADFSREYTSEISTTTAGAVDNNDGGIVYDVAGNMTACAADQTVKIDKTKPSCNVTGGSTAWTNGSRTIKAECKDLQSGCATKDFSKEYTSEISTTTAGAISNGNGGSVTDNAGNTTTCSANQTVKIDKTDPIISSIYNPTSGNATDESFSLTLTGSDNGGSEISHWSYKYSGSSWKKYSDSANSPFITPKFSTIRNEDVYIKLCDNAGNCSDAETSPIYIVNDMCEKTVSDECGSWNWTTCTKECGGGTQYQIRTCTLKSAYDNKTSCPGTKEETQKENTPCGEQSCSTNINETLYEGCDSYYITTCTADLCTYTKKNGVSTTGTINYSNLDTKRSGDCKKYYCGPYIGKQNGTKVSFNISPKLEQCKIDSYTAGSCTKVSNTDHNLVIDFSKISNGAGCSINVDMAGIYLWNGKEYGTMGWTTYRCSSGKYCTDSCSSNVCAN